MVKRYSHNWYCFVNFIRILCSSELFVFVQHAIVKRRIFNPMWYVSICLTFPHFHDVCIAAVDQPQCYTFKAWKNHSNNWGILVIMHWYMFSQVNHRSICVCLFTESPWIGRRHFWVEYIFYSLCAFLVIYLWFWSFEDGQFGKINTFLTNTFIPWLLLHRTMYSLFFLSVNALTVANIYRLRASYLSIYS